MMTIQTSSGVTFTSPWLLYALRKALKKPLPKWAFVGLAGLFVSEESSLAVLVPQRLAVEVVGLSWLAFEGLQVDDLISLALHINDLLQKPARLIIRPTDQYLLYFSFVSSSNQVIKNIQISVELVFAQGDASYTPANYLSPSVCSAANPVIAIICLFIPLSAVSFTLPRRCCDCRLASTISYPAASSFQS